MYGTEHEVSFLPNFLSAYPTILFQRKQTCRRNEKWELSLGWSTGNPPCKQSMEAFIFSLEDAISTYIHASHSIHTSPSWHYNKKDRERLLPTGAVSSCRTRTDAEILGQTVQKCGSRRVSQRKQNGLTSEVYQGTEGNPFESHASWRFQRAGTCTCVRVCGVCVSGPILSPATPQTPAG